MSKFYKYTFVIALLLILTSINFWSTFNNGENRGINNYLKQSRIESHEKSNKIIGNLLEGFSAKNIETNIPHQIQNDSTIVFVLVSSKGCFSCFKRELKNLGMFCKDRIQIIGLVKGVDKNFALSLKRELNVYIPFYICGENIFRNLSFANKYPQIVVVRNGTIISAFLPIPRDDKFSEEYYKNLLSVIDKSQ